MDICSLKYHLKIYKRYINFALIQITQYRVSFFIGLFIELGYLLWTIVFYKVLFANIGSIGGWSEQEIFILVGVSIVYGELLLGLFHIFNLRELPARITNGDIDFALLKPMNNRFALTASRIYTGSIISTFVGFYLIITGLNNLHITIGFTNLVAAVWVFGCGIVIGYSFQTLISSFAFKFTRAEFLPRLANDISHRFGTYPSSIYVGFMRILVFTIVPFIFTTSIPVEMIIRGVSVPYIAWATFLAVVFFIGMQLVWKRMIALYSSASS